MSQAPLPPWPTPRQRTAAKLAVWGTALLVLLFCARKPASARKLPAPDPKAAPEQLIRYQESTMGTVVSLVMWTSDETLAAKAAAEVFAEFERVDRLMSSWLPESDVARINAAAGGKAVVVDPEVLSLIQKAQAASRKSKGAFDITVGSFRGLWKFDQDIDGSIPSDEEVKKRTELVDYRKVQVQGAKKRVRLGRKGSRITLGGLAKGYAVDQAVALLHKRGLKNFILQAGGDLYASGRRGDRRWRVGIRDPRGGKDKSFAVSEIENGTFSTSGDYERSVVKEGKRYHHLLDPKTGYPATASRSVTVYSESALEADIWSTTLFIIGVEKGLALAESLDGIEAVFVDADNHVHITSGLKDKVRVLTPPSPGV